MSARLLAVMMEFLEEMQSLVDADDGTVFQIQHIDMLIELEQLIEEEANDE